MDDHNQKKSLIETSLFKRFVPFHQLSEKHIQEIAKHAAIKKIAPKTLIFKRNLTLSQTFYLISGTIDLCDASYQVRGIESTAEDPFKVPLNTSDSTPYAAISTSNVNLLVIDSDKLDLVLTWSEAGEYLVEDLNEHEDDQDWMSDLLQSNLLQRIPPSNIQQLFTSFTHETFRKGQSIIKQGDPGEHFYVLSQGTAEVSRLSDDGEPIPLAKLTTGKFFGEAALISDAPRNASVTMLTDGACMKLNKETFTRLLKEPVIKTVTAKEYKDLLEKGEAVKLVDLRSQEESQAEPIQDALLIPFSELRQKLDGLDRDLTYITHKVNGRRAELAAYLLNDAGLNALVMR